MKQKSQEVILGTLVRLCRGACQLYKITIEKSDREFSISRSLLILDYFLERSMNN